MSQKFSLNRDDLVKVLKNAFIFLAPALLVFFATLQQGGSTHTAFVALEVWGVNTIVDVLRKFVEGK